MFFSGLGPVVVGPLFAMVGSFRDLSDICQTLQSALQFGQAAEALLVHGATHFALWLYLLDPDEDNSQIIFCWSLEQMSPPRVHLRMIISNL
jgi:hypothetical protein